MLKYIIKRLLIMIPTMLAIIFIIFFIVQLMPSTPGRIILGIKASEEQVYEKNKELGYYDPLPVKYYHYVKNALISEPPISLEGRSSMSFCRNSRLPCALLFSQSLQLLLSVSYLASSRRKKDTPPQMS